MAKNDDRMTLRDAKLKARVLRLVARSDGGLTQSEILRAAVAEYTEKIEREGKVEKLVNLHPETRDGGKEK